MQDGDDAVLVNYSNHMFLLLLLSVLLMLCAVIHIFMYDQYDGWMGS